MTLEALDTLVKICCIHSYITQFCTQFIHNSKRSSCLLFIKRSNKRFCQSIDFNFYDIALVCDAHLPTTPSHWPKFPHQHSCILNIQSSDWLGLCHVTGNMLAALCMFSKQCKISLNTAFNSCLQYIVNKITTVLVN